VWAVREDPGVSCKEGHRFARDGKGRGGPGLDALGYRQLRHERELAEAKVRELLVPQILDDLDRGLAAARATRG